MKKFLILVTALVFSFVLIGCDQTSEVTATTEVVSTTTVTTELTDQGIVDMDIDALEVSLPTTLPNSSENGTSYEWETSNSLVVSDTGFLVRPGVSSDPVDVTLTCTASKGTYSTERVFEFTIQPNPEVTVTSKASYDFEGTSEEYVVENSTVDLYFVDEGSVPYMDVQAFINMIDGAIESDMITVTPVGDNQLSLEYTYEYLDFDEVTTLYEDYSALIDFDENTFTVNNYDFFGGYVAETESDFGEGLEYTDAYYIDGVEVTIPLGEYNFDLVIYDDAGTDVFLMPFSILDILLLGNVYYNTYYNGDMIYGVDTFDYSNGDQYVIADIHDSSFNDVEDVPEDMKLATYHYLALAIDYFYGLKEDKGITGYEFIGDRAKYMIDKTNDKLYESIFKVAYGLDDLHTSHSFTGYYATDYFTQNFAIPLYWEDIGPGTEDFYNGLYDVQDLLVEKYGESMDIPDYELLDNDTKAVIHLLGFEIETPDDVKLILDSLPATVEDVVIDLSYNTGGNLGAVLRLYGYMTENTLSYHSQNPADGSAATFYFESDYVAYDYNWYVLTSSVTFSAANLFASMAKENGIPVLGQNSSGGASSIGFVTLPDGSGIMISTNSVLSTRIGDTEETYQYLSIENGIEVDYRMSNVVSDNELIAVINNIKASNPS